MSGFHRQRLSLLRRAAGLGSPVPRRSVVDYTEARNEAPMPSFHVPGVRDKWESEDDYIDARYFSPAAIKWADAVVEYRAQGARLESDDEECFARVWTAMRAGRHPTDGQQREFDKDEKWKRAFARVPEVYALEMKRRGVTNYGPDEELPDDMKEPGSSQELVYRYLYKELGYKTADSAATAHKTWKKEKKDRAKDGMR